MDTLFRLVSFQPDQQSFNSSRTSSSSRSSRQANTHHHQRQQLYHHQYTTEEDEEECCNTTTNNSNTNNIYMDEDDFSSSSSSKQYYYPYGAHHPPTSATTATPTTTYTTPTTTASYNTPPAATSSHHGGQLSFEPAEFSFPQGFNLDVEVDFTSSGKWASELLLECARAVAGRDTSRVQQLMWMLNELSSPYGDTNQKLAAYFLQALFARMTSSGARTLRTLASAYDRNCSFDSTRKTTLRFQEVSPWSTFGHVASNGAILEAFDGEPRLHILDLSNTFCTQWPTLLEALATRSDDTPHLRLTTVVSTRGGGVADGGSAATSSNSSAHKVMKEIGARMEKFARLMGVPFKFQAVYHDGDLAELDFDALTGGADGDEAIAINCVNALHGVGSAALRDSVMAAFRRLRPKIVTIVEEEADISPDDGDYVRAFGESLRFFGTYFDSLDESFPKTSNERLALERAAGRAIVDLVACEPGESTERRETGSRWSGRLRAAGFSPVPLSDDVSDDVRALLRRYREGWSMAPSGETDPSAAGVFLSWKEQQVVWASAWKP
ncbi:hypothetical protein Taro_038190 [Colocasia esculenta]|uniref:SHORT-ROOT protein n=1 Tax=Colocasia esculenta TaxID=4460 RepID=A0A843WRY6_COLES|nr:hypothetical protein [Colocasia esculenta]